MSTVFETALEQSAKMSINLAAAATGMKPEQVAGMLADSIPQAMSAAQADPAAATEVFKQSFAVLPEPVQKVYERMGSAAVAKGATADDFVNMFGQSAKALQSTAAEMASTTPQQAGTALGASVPALAGAFQQAARAAGQTAQSIASIPAPQAQQMLGEAAASTAAVFNRLAGR